MEMMRENANVVYYDPTKGVTVEELVEFGVKLSNLPRQFPEYILSKHEAETLPLEWLNWLGENYRVLCSLEVSNIIKEREKGSLK